MAASSTFSASSCAVIPAPPSAQTAPAPGAFALTLRDVSVLLPGGRTLLHRLNTTFPPQHTGLVGRNGSGKSVLLRVLAGIHPPDTGQVLRRGAIAYVAQNLAPNPGATLADVAGLGPVLAAFTRMAQGEPHPTDFDLLDGQWGIHARLAQALADAGLGQLGASHPAHALSGGELTRVALLGAFLSGTDALVLDEPTNHLDQNARQWLLAQLRAWPGAAIIASHDRELLDTMAHTVALGPNGLHTYGGNFRLYQAQRQAEADAAQAALDHSPTERKAAVQAQRQQHDDQQRRTARNTAAAQNANLAAIYKGQLKRKAQVTAGRVHQRQQENRAQLDDALRQAAARVEPRAAVALMLPATTVPSGKRVLTLEQVVLPFTTGQPPLDLALDGPVRVGVYGTNGCGKTRLLKVMAGQLPPASGQLRRGVPAAWLDQLAQALLPPEVSVPERLQTLHTPLQEGMLRSHLALLGLGAAQVQTPAQQLSGGERLKAALACALWGQEPAQLLLLDEPTNHLDMDAVTAFEQALAAYPGALVAASHDTRFLAALRLTHQLCWTPSGWRLEMC